MSIRRLGPTRRKGEFIIGFAEDILSGERDLDHLEQCDPRVFYDAMNNVRGVGPTSAQQLMLMRGRTDAVFPSQVQKGEEKKSKRNNQTHNSTNEQYFLL